MGPPLDELEKKDLTSLLELSARTEEASEDLSQEAPQAAPVDHLNVADPMGSLDSFLPDPAFPMDAPLQAAVESESQAAEIPPWQDIGDGFQDNLQQNQNNNEVPSQVTEFQPPIEKQDLSDVKEFGNKIAIGSPKIEGSPAFSLLARSNNGRFSPHQIKYIENAVTTDDLGVRLEDVRVQLASGKLFVPQVSEFAAISLAQRLRDIVDDIEIDLAKEIFQSSANELAPEGEAPLGIDPLDAHQEETRDLSDEPATENELFSSNLPEPPGYRITRILATVTASEIIDSLPAEPAATNEFEAATERLIQQLIHKAFKLGAHGVIGMKFASKPIESRQANRLLATGTAVRAKRIP